MNEQEQQQVDINFFNMVISLSQSALVGMGKVTNPQTNQVQKNMDIAKINIDILEMLKEKTKGNLSKKEQEILSDTLTNLQLTFADEMKKGPSEQEKEEPKQEQQEQKQEKEENKEE